MPTNRPVDDLLYLFREGQAPQTVSPLPWQDLIVSLHPATGTFQDLPASPAGLANGRIYRNGDILTVSSGGGPAQQPAFAAMAGGGGLLAANVRARLAGRGTFGGAGGLSANASIPFVFEDQFNNLSLYNQFTASPGTWYPSQYYAPENGGYAISPNTWVLNPLNPATPISGSYAVSGGNLQLLMANTPAPYLSAVSNRKYLGTQLVATNVATFGRFEARFSVPSINGTLIGFFLISNSGGGSPVTTEINLEIPTGATWSPRSQWQFAIPAPGYVGPAYAEYYSYQVGAPAITLTDMNTFTFDMRPTFVACSVNGIEVMRVAPPAEFGHTPWNIYLMQIDGSDWTGPLDASPVFTPMLVDYVRVTA